MALGNMHQCLIRGGNHCGKAHQVFGSQDKREKQAFISVILIAIVLPPLNIPMYIIKWSCHFAFGLSRSPPPPLLPLPTTHPSNFLLTPSHPQVSRRTSTQLSANGCFVALLTCRDTPAALNSAAQKMRWRGGEISALEMFNCHLLMKYRRLSAHTHERPLVAD